MTATQQTLTHPTQATQSRITPNLLKSAERELAAFLRAVNDTFGSRQAQIALEDWMELVEDIEWREDGTVPQWRQVTIQASCRLAGRISVKGKPVRVTVG